MRHTTRSRYCHHQPTSIPTSVEPHNLVCKSHPKWHTRQTPSLHAFTSRGGGQQPGKPTHHRFWTHHNTGLSNTEDNVLCLTASHLRIHILYNPPGDGMCFWHSIVNGLQPGIRTHYDRMHAAVCTQRRVIQFVREQSRQPEKLNQYISLLRDSLPASTTINHTTLETQLAELEQCPQLYDLPVNDILRMDAAHALRCHIVWWCVYRPQDDHPQVYSEAYGEGEAVHIMYIPSAKHYMHIVGTSPHSPCGHFDKGGSEQYSDIGVTAPADSITRNEHVAVSWKLAQTLHVTWLENVWTRVTDTDVIFSDMVAIGQDHKGWQQYDNITIPIPKTDIDKLCGRILPQYRPRTVGRNTVQEQMTGYHTMSYNEPRQSASIPRSRKSDHLTSTCEADRHGPSRSQNKRHHPNLTSCRPPQLRRLNLPRSLFGNHAFGIRRLRSNNVYWLHEL